MTEPKAIAQSHNIRRLGGSDIGRCLTKIHHDRFTSVAQFEDEVRTRDIERGIEHETSVIAKIEETALGLVRILGTDEAAISATLKALDEEAPIVAGAWLVSRDATSVGAHDLLVRLDDGYAPVEVKNHKILGTGGIPASIATFEALAQGTGEPVKFRGNRRRDLYQGAHYRSLLLDIGHASVQPLVGVVGSDEPLMCLWVDLAAGAPSLWDEYQMHRQRAQDAIAHGMLHPETPMEDPWLRGECSRCDWKNLCRSQLLSTNDVTLLTNISSAERTDLAAGGIQRIDQVADLEPMDERIGDASIVFQARARTAQQLLRFAPSHEPLDIPNAEHEVDFDIETYKGSIYLAGFLTTRSGSSEYESIADWTGTPEGEKNLVAQLFGKLASLARPQAVVMHWTDYEQRTLVEAGQRHRLSIPGFETVQDWFDANAIDLCDWVRQNLVSPSGYGLKTIAPLADFFWRDNDPGGRQSEIWFEAFLNGDDAMRGRVLKYNEDDVAAQLAIRQWLISQDAGLGPGSSIPSVSDWPPGGSHI